MVLCKFFQQGNCRFGTKCNNEHFDVKQIIKTDVESALNGNQWPLSCFGPFKDKPCIPNFIDDQSYEEIRFLCYESKQKNFFEQFHQQFTKEVLDAKNKMKALLQLTPDIVDVVTKVYEAPIESAGGGAPKTSNPFGIATANGASAASIFSKPAAANTATGNNVFGGGSGNSLFSTTAVPTNVFATQQPTATPPMFGQQQTSIFAQPTPPQTNSIFCAGTQPPAFGQVVQNSAAATGSGIFAQALKQQPTAPPSGLFAQAGQQQQQTVQQPGFGIFAQAAQQMAPSFQQQQSPFGQQSIPQQQQQTGLFGQAMQQQQQPAASGNIFAQQQQKPPQQQQPQQGGLFANAVTQPQSVFAQQQQQTQGSNIFTQAAQQTQASTGGGFFQQMPQQQQNQHAFIQQSNQTTNIAHAPQLAVANASLYSRMENLTAEEIEAFKADCFSVGKVPFSPPPRELIN